MLARLPAPARDQPAVSPEFHSRSARAAGRCSIRRSYPQGVLLRLDVRFTRLPDSFTALTGPRLVHIALPLPSPAVTFTNKQQPFSPTRNTEANAGREIIGPRQVGFAPKVEGSLDMG